jgi:hypothetical protein
MKPLSCGDLYSAWLAGVRGLSERPAGIVPSVMQTDGFADLRVASAIAGYGQLRHNFVLVAAPSYDVAGCAIPDGWVDPAIGTYDALLAYAARGAEVSRALGSSADAKYFERLHTILSVLRRIAADELAGRALTDEEKRFLSMVVEMVPGSTGGPPTYTGWYLEMFRSLEEAVDGAGFVADVFTSAHTGEVAYVGARAPRLGVFVVDSGGPPRAFVGPVASTYEHVGSVEKRLGDADAAKLEHVSSPWSAGVVVAAPAVVRLRATLDMESGAYTIESKEPQAGVVVEALDHHGAVIGSVTVDAGPKAKSGRIRAKDIDGLRVRAGDFSAVTMAQLMQDALTVDTMGR